MKRHQQWRIFHGRLTELLFAASLEANGRSVTGLEALRRGADIETRTVDGARETFELKFIGTEDTDFGAYLQSIAGEHAGTWVSPYAAANYVTFRVYEAARQLNDRDAGRTAVIVIDGMTWWRFGIPLKNQWIHWASPSFFTEDERWNRFLETQTERYPSLPDDLTSWIASLSRIMIVRQESDLTFETMHEFVQEKGGWNRT
jgi:hypothetical protein